MFNKKRFIFILLILISSYSTLPQEEEFRFFDQAKPDPTKIYLSIFHGSTSTLKTLIILKEEGIFSPKNLQVISIFHEEESRAHEKSESFIKEKRIDWIKFHVVTGNLNETNLFQTNELTPEFRKIFEKSDGIILFGGDDIPPYIYGEETSLITNIKTPIRHFLELSLVFHLLGGHQNPAFEPFLAKAPEYPLLGICLGAQTLNVGTGGTLIQDIPSKIYGKTSLEEVLSMSTNKRHENPWNLIHPEKELFPGTIHPILLLEKEVFTDQWGFKSIDKPLVWSSHHQTVAKLGKGMKIIATSLDGKVVEAIAHDKYFHVLGVQFHPESSNIWDAERRNKFTPDEEREVRLIDILEEHPPSLAFHKKIWSWFSAKLEQHHRKKSDLLND